MSSEKYSTLPEDRGPGHEGKPRLKQVFVSSKTFANRSELFSFPEHGIRKRRNHLFVMLM